MTAFSRRSIVWLQLGLKLYTDKHYRGAEKYAMIYLRYLGVALRVIVYSIVAIVTFNKRLFTKARFFGAALAKVCTLPWKYNWNQRGEVVPWTKYL